MLCFVIDSFVLQNASNALRQSFADLAHYFVFHYECEWKIFADQAVSLKSWHPLVPSPIPYPNVEVSADIAVSETTVLITNTQRAKLVQDDMPCEVFFIEQNHNQVAKLKQNILERMSEKLLMFKKVIAPSQRFYSLFFAGAWEEVFYKRTRLLPSENHDCDRFGPFTYYRCLEYRWSLAQLSYLPGLKTLDIGSLDTFVPRYLAEQNLDVISIDIDPSGVELQNKVASQLSKPFCALVEDITQTTFPNNIFDQATIISVIEHIPGDGDIRAMKQIHRILKKNGIVAITVPYDHHWAHEDMGLRPDNYMQRYYTMQSAIERLIQPPLFEVVDIEYIGGEMISVGNFKEKFSNPTNAAIICLALRKK